MIDSKNAIRQSKIDFCYGSFRGVNYAHRGLHDIDNGIPENSLAAFRLAAESGYGIELDVQLSRDGYVVVFHDDTLKRVCGIDARVDEYDYRDLKTMSLLGTDEHIPLFTEVLEVLSEKGSSPLIVELKTGPRNDELCTKTYEILKKYNIRYCVESFNPFIVYWFRKNAPGVFRGQLASEKSDYLPEQSKITACLLSECAFNILARPDFIAYKNTERPRRIKNLRKRGIMLASWTSREPEIDQKTNDAVIFEKYRPSPRYTVSD